MGKPCSKESLEVGKISHNDLVCSCFLLRNIETSTHSPNPCSVNQTNWSNICVFISWSLHQYLQNEERVKQNWCLNLVAQIYQCWRNCILFYQPWWLNYIPNWKGMSQNDCPKSQTASSHSGVSNRTAKGGIPDELFIFWYGCPILERTSPSIFSLQPFVFLVKFRCYTVSPRLLQHLQ